MSAPVARPPRQAQKPPPAGAARWSRMYLDANHLPQKSDTDIPVDDNGYRTAHIRWFCKRGHLDVTIQDGARERKERQRCDHEVWRMPSEVADIFCPHHGREPLVTTDKVKRPMPWADLLRAGRRPGYPLVALGALATAGSSFHDNGTSFAEVAPAVPLVWVGAYLGVRWWQTRDAETAQPPRLDKGQRSGREWRKILRRSRLAGYLAAGSGAWLSAAAAVDPHSVVGTAVWFALPPLWALGAAPWWRHLADLRNRKPEPTPEPEKPVVVALSQDEIDAKEAARLWAEGDVAPNTALDVTTWKRIPCGWQAVIRATKRGALNNLGDDNQRATAKRVASAFSITGSPVPKSAITWIEEHDEDPNAAMLLVQPKNPLKDGQLWAGPSSIEITESRIIAEVGRFIDGEAMLETLFRFDEGMPSELVLGSTGSGKSERLRLSLLVQRWASFVNPQGVRQGLFLSFLHDPKRLNSYGEFRDAVHGYGITRDDAHIMIDAFLREMIRRYDMLSSIVWYDEKDRRRVGSVKWDPRIHGALLKVIWDEFHELAGDKAFVEKLEKLARYQRACGMGATLASHMGTLSDTGSQALRDMLAGGRATLLRTTSGLNAALATGGQLTADPRGLPKVAGMALVADGEGPTVMGRYAFVPDDKGAARMGTRSLYDWLFDDDNQPIGFPAVIPAETAEAFGPEFMQWMEAGRSERGREGWSYSATPALVPTEDASAVEALRRILFAAVGPLKRDEIAKHPLWGSRSVTSTLTAALKAGREADRAWAVKSGAGPATTYELAPWAREQMAAVDGEAEQVAAAEQVAGDDQMTLL